MRVGVDATCIATVPEEGKDQVIYNLLRGWHELGLGSRLIVYCYSFLEERLRQMLPGAELRVFQRLRFGKRLFQDLPLRTFVLPRRARADGVDVLLFPKICTGLRRFPIPTLVIPHDIQCRAFPRNYSKSMLIRELVCHAIDFKLRDRIVAVSQFDAKEIRHYYPRHADKVVSIYNPIHFAEAEPASDGAPHPKPYLLSVNFRYPHKNTITLLRAFDAIRDRLPHDLILVGKLHPTSQHLVDFVERRNLTDRVRFTGYVEEAHLHELIRHAELFVNTSLYEGFGMTPVEAMGAGTPVLSTRDTALFETTRGLVEYYEPSTEPGALAERLLNVLENMPSAASRQDARQTVRDLYDYRVIARKYWDLFSSLNSTGQVCAK